MQDDLDKIVLKVLKEDSDYFYRLPNKVINNDVYKLKKNATAFCDSLLKGNDFNTETAYDLIESLKKLIKESKAFYTTDTVPKEYQ